MTRADGLPPHHDQRAGKLHTSAGWRDDTPEALPAGILWDAVKTRRPHGAAALAHLKTRMPDALVGPIIADNDHMWFFIVPGTSQAWPPSVAHLSDGSFVAVPPPYAGDSHASPHWIHRPILVQWRPSRRLTDPAALCASLQVTATHTTEPCRATQYA